MADLYLQTVAPHGPSDIVLHTSAVSGSTPASPGGGSASRRRLGPVFRVDVDLGTVRVRIPVRTAAVDDVLLVPAPVDVGRVALLVPVSVRSTSEVDVLTPKPFRLSLSRFAERVLVNEVCPPVFVSRSSSVAVGSVYAPTGRPAFVRQDEELLALFVAALS